MANFNFSLDNIISNDSMNNSVIGNQKNYTPLGEEKGLVTSQSADPEPRRALTTSTVSDILQGQSLYKNQGLVQTQFNEVLSNSQAQLLNMKINGSRIQSTESAAYLTGYDIPNAKVVNNLLNIDYSTGGTSGTPVSSTSPGGIAAPPSSGFILPKGQYRFPEHKTHYSNPSSGTQAIDIGADAGTPVFSPWDGKVEYIGHPTSASQNSGVGGQVKPGSSPDPDGGNAIVIQSDDGFSIYMAHFMSPPIVSIGDRVTKGQHVAYVGETGRASGPHVHASGCSGGNWTHVFGGIGKLNNIWDFMKEIESKAG